MSRNIPLKICDSVVATTEMLKKHLVKMGISENKIIVIPNGLTLPLINECVTQNDSKVILCLARLDTAIKGQDILLQAMPKVLSEVPGVQLWVVGEGPDSKKLKKIATKLKLDNNVKFKGSVPEGTKVSYMKNCQVLCVPSRTESFGIVNLEAMAYGLPIVTTRSVESLKWSVILHFLFHQMTRWL